MTGSTEKWLREILDEEEAQGLYRQLPEPLPQGKIDLRSNDHLGLSRSKELEVRIKTALQEEVLRGSTGSRAISGNSELIMELEAEMAQHYRGSNGLLFSSGYQANIGTVAALGGRKATLLYDEKVHASMRDGIRLAFARSRSFSHNEPAKLEERLQKAEGPTVVLTEGLYSIDGDLIPLQEIVELTETYDASLVVDEAHSNGVLGSKGEGLVHRDGLQDRVFARIFPFGKAMAQQGALVTGSSTLKEFLVGHARSFIYSTAPSFPALIALRESFRYAAEAREARASLFERVRYFKEMAEGQAVPVASGAEGPIQGIPLGSNDAVCSLEAYLWDQGYAVKGIRKPTVPEGEERIRVVLHADTPYEAIDEVLRLSAARI